MPHLRLIDVSAATGALKAEYDAAVVRAGKVLELTAQPAAIGHADVEELRAQGWDDSAIHDAIQVIANFNYIKRS